MHGPPLGAIVIGAKVVSFSICGVPRPGNTVAGAKGSAIPGVFAARWVQDRASPVSSAIQVHMAQMSLTSPWSSGAGCFR